MFFNNNINDWCGLDPFRFWYLFSEGEGVCLKYLLFFCRSGLKVWGRWFTTLKPTMFVQWPAWRNSEWILVFEFHNMIYFTKWITWFWLFLYKLFCFCARLVGWECVSWPTLTGRSLWEGKNKWKEPISFFRPHSVSFISQFSSSFYWSITRTFASGKTEKGIFQALKDLGLPSGKVKNK